MMVSCFLMHAWQSVSPRSQKTRENTLSGSKPNFQDEKEIRTGEPLLVLLMSYSKVSPKDASLVRTGGRL